MNLLSSNSKQDTESGSSNYMHIFTNFATQG